MVKKDDRQNYNRAVILMVIGIFATTWVLFNSWEYLKGSVGYVVLGVFLIFAYWNWDRIKNLKW